MSRAAIYEAAIISVVMAGSYDNLVSGSVCVRYRKHKKKEPRISAAMAYPTYSMAIPNSACW